MKLHPVRTYRSEEPLPREEQLAWKAAQVAVDPIEVEADVVDMIVNRVIDLFATGVAPPRCRPGGRVAGVGHDI